MRSRYFTHSRERDFRLVKDFERKEWFGGIRGEEEFLVRRRARRRRERGGAMSTSIRGDDSFWAETNAAVDGTRSHLSRSGGGVLTVVQVRENNCVFGNMIVFNIKLSALFCSSIGFFLRDGGGFSPFSLF